MRSFVKIAGHDYEIIEDAAYGWDRSFGCIELGKLKIRVDPANAPGRNFGTVVHEIVEAMNHEYELGLDHHHICVIDAALCQIARDNPGIFDYPVEG